MPLPEVAVNVSSGELGRRRFCVRRSGLTMLSGHSVGTYQGNELTRNSAGNVRPRSSQLAEGALSSTITLVDYGHCPVTLFSII